MSTLAIAFTPDNCSQFLRFRNCRRNFRVRALAFATVRKRSHVAAQNDVSRAEADYAALHAAATRLKQASDARPGLIAEQELDDATAKDHSAEAAVEGAKSELAASRQQLEISQADRQHYAALSDYSRITAPFDGVVTWRYADTGSLIQAGTSNISSAPVVKLSQVDILRLRIPVPESLAASVHDGEPADIRVKTRQMTTFPESLPALLARSTLRHEPCRSR